MKNDVAPALAPTMTLFVRLESILKAICDISIYLLYNIHTAGGNAVGPYKDHFCMGKKGAKKLKYPKNQYKYATLGLKCTFSPNMNKKLKKKNLTALMG
jgi:hypothetical protein